MNINEEETVQFISSQEQAWVGKAVIAQREDTGLSWSV